MTEKDHETGKNHKNFEFSDDTKNILARLHERRKLLAEAIKAEKHLSQGAAVVLQAHVTDTGTNESEKQPYKAAPEDILGAVDYRLAITDLFVEKAQYHLERRADHYRLLGYALYVIAVSLFCLGSYFAIFGLPVNNDVGCLPKVVCAEQSVVATSSPSSVVTTSNVQVGTSAVVQQPAILDTTDKWINFLRGFVRAFTAYGLIVLTAVILARGARACLDQRERLLTKRHSLRQGRLYLHLTGGRVTVEDLERAFNWNHEQHNAFTHMPTDAKAPWGNVAEEIVKIVPELVKTGVNATRETAEKNMGKIK